MKNCRRHTFSSKPLVSIITVTWNCVSTIGRTLASVQEVKNGEIEYIVIDGGSTDGTLEVISACSGLVDYFVSEPDSGIYNAMNKGVDVAQGEYLLFLNGDDHLIADGFKKAVHLLSVKRPDVLSCCSEVVSETGEKLEILSPVLWKLMFFNTIPHLSTFVSSKLHKKFHFREQFTIAADYDFFLRLYLEGYEIELCKQVTAVHYRGGASNNSDQAVLETRSIRREHLGFSRYTLSRFIESINYVKYLLLSRLRAHRLTSGV